MAHGVGVAKVIPHELLDRQQTGGGRIAAQLGDAKLLGPIKHVGGLTGVEVHLVAQPQQEFDGSQNRRQVFLVELAQGSQLAEIGGSVANQAEPADQLDVAQRSPRPLHVRLQEEDRLAVAQPFFPAVVLDSRHEPAGAAMRLPQEAIFVVGEQRFAAAQETGFDQRRADHRLVARHPTRLLGRPHAVADDQAGVENVAQQPLGQRRHAAADAGAMQDHQVHVAIRGNVAPPIAGVGDQGDLRPKPVGPGLVQIDQRRVGQIDQHFVAQIADRRTEFYARTPVFVSPLERRVPFGKPLLGSQHVGAERGHGNVKSPFRPTRRCGCGRLRPGRSQRSFRRPPVRSGRNG